MNSKWGVIIWYFRKILLDDLGAILALIMTCLLVGSIAYLVGSLMPV